MPDLVNGRAAIRSHRWTVTTLGRPRYGWYVFAPVIGDARPPSGMHPIGVLPGGPWYYRDFADAIAAADRMARRTACDLDYCLAEVPGSGRVGR